MPTNRTRRAQQRRAGVGLRLDPDLVVELMTGLSYFHDEHIVSNEALRTVWESHRDQIRQLWRDEHGPGTRCFAEWLFEVIPRYGERPVLPGCQELIEYRSGWTRRGILHRPGQQPEVEFLRRHGLLDEAEVVSSVS